MEETKNDLWICKCGYRNYINPNQKGVIKTKLKDEYLREYKCLNCNHIIQIVTPE